jgi:hypothetical protein
MPWNPIEKKGFLKFLTPVLSHIDSNLSLERLLVHLIMQRSHTDASAPECVDG